ncbi:SAC7 [Sanghuangporus sanghuang]
MSSASNSSEVRELHVKEASTSSSSSSVSVTTSPRVKPAPSKDAIPVPFDYAASDDGMDENLLILLHGLGDTHIPFGKLGRQLHLPQTATLALRAPQQIPYLEEGAYQWYPSFDDLGETIVHPNPEAGVSLLRNVISHLTSTCSWKTQQIHLFGFAQGGSVALETCISIWKSRPRLLPGGTQSDEEAEANATLGSVISVGGPLLLHHAISTPCATPLLFLHRAPPSALALDGSGTPLASLRKLFGKFREVKLGSGESMPASREEWVPVMEFWSERLVRRSVQDGGLNTYYTLPSISVLILALSPAQNHNPGPISATTATTQTNTTSAPRRHPLIRLAAVAFRGTRPQATSFACPASPDAVAAVVFSNQQEFLQDRDTRFSEDIPRDRDKDSETNNERHRRRFSQQISTSRRRAPQESQKAELAPVLLPTSISAPPHPHSTSHPHFTDNTNTSTITSTNAVPVPVPASTEKTMLHTTRAAAHHPPDTDTELPLREREREQSDSPSPPPPTKASLKAWWNQFKFMQRMKVGAGVGAGAGGDQTKALPPGYSYNYGLAKDDGPHPVFGAPLNESLKYAAVQISTANSNGELYVWGDIPVVVAKCGLYLKENATEVEGTFRVSGSNKRMRDLQAIFETPPKYGKNLDWKKENYTPHDVASVFRRYLTQMPEPVIPHNLYSKFREPLAKRMSTDDVIKIYKQLIRSMPSQNQYLLLYVLDLLSVFARKADKNLMTATNLAVIFRPGLINHPQHELSPKEHNLSQEVLEFLIEHQDWFMLDVPPPPPRSHSYQTNPRSQNALPSIPDEERERERQRSGSPHPTMVSIASGWRLVEKPADYTTSGSGAGAGQTGPGSTPRRGSRSGGGGGRRRSSSAASSGEHAVGGGGSSHVRLASADAPLLTSSSHHTGAGSASGTVGSGVVTVARSRTLPPRTERSRKDKDLSRDGTMKEREREREQRHREVRDRDREREAGNAPPTSAGATAASRNVLKKQKRASMQNQSQRVLGAQQQLVTVPFAGNVQKHSSPTSGTGGGTS